MTMNLFPTYNSCPNYGSASGTSSYETNTKLFIFPAELGHPSMYM